MAFSLEKSPNVMAIRLSKSHHHWCLSTYFKQHHRAAVAPNMAKISSRPLTLATASVWIGCKANSTVAINANDWNHFSPLFLWNNMSSTLYISRHRSVK